MSAFRLHSTGLLALTLFLTARPVCGQSVQTTAGYTSLADGGLIVDPGYGQYGNVFGMSPIGSRGGYLWVEGVFGERPGSQGDTFNIGTFMPGPQVGSGMLFADVQIFGDENALVGIDANIGWRTLLGEKTMFGAYGFYTHDHSINEYAYDWIGAGLQVARSHLQLDSNVYLPLGDRQNNVGARIPTANFTTQGTTAGFIDLQRVEQNMRGVDLNVTTWVPGYEWLYGGAGVYHFNAEDGENTSGYRLRAGLDFNSVQVNTNVTNDSLFGTSADVSVTYLMGRGGFACGLGGCDRAIDRRLYDRVVKQRRIATTTFLTEVFTPASDGRGGTLDIAYVRNNNLQPGDGSYEDPLQRLDFANGLDVDIIAVLRGSTDSTTKLAAGDGLVLAPFQRLLGEGEEHFINIPGRGVFLVPHMDTAGAHPFVTANPGAAIVTMASQTEINGLNLMPADGGFAIRGHNFRDFAIRNINNDVPMAMTTGLGSGILLRNAAGTGLIDQVAFNVGNPAAYGGIRIENTNTQALDLTLRNAPFVTGGQVGVGIAATNSEINAQVRDVHASGNGTALHVESYGTGEVNVAIQDSSFNDAVTGHGIAISGDMGLLNLAFTNTTATGAAADNMHIVLQNDSLLNLGGLDVDLTAAGRDAINLFADDGDANVNFLRVQGDGAGRDGINIFANNTASINFNVTDGSFVGVGRDADHVEAFNLSTVNLVIDPTPSTGAGRHGLFFNAQSDAQVNILFENSNLSTALAPTGSHAIFGTLGGGALVNLILDNSHAALAGGNALLVNASSGAQFDALFLNSSFAGAAGNAFEISLDNAVSNLQVTGGSAGGAADSALVVTATNNSQFQGALDGSNLSAAMTGDGVRLNFDNSVGTLALTNTPNVNAGDNAFDLTATNNSALGVSVLNSPSYGAKGEAVLFNADTNSTLGLTATNSDLSTAANPALGGGIRGTLDNGATATVVLNNSDVASVGTVLADDAVHIEADNGSTFNGSITASSLEDAAGDAVSIVLNNGSGGMLLLDGAPGNRAGDDGLFLFANNNSNFSANLSNGTTFDNAGAAAMRLFSDNGSVVNVVGDGVSGRMAGADGLQLDAIGGTINLALTNTGDFTSAGDDAIDIRGSAATLNVNITGGPGPFDMATFEGLIANLSNGSQATINLANLSFDGAGFDGLEIIATDSMFAANVANSSFDNVDFDAFDFTLNNSTGQVILSNTTGMGAGDNAVEIAATNDSQLTLQLLNGVMLDGADADIFNITANNSLVSITGPSLSGAGAGGDVIDFTAANGATVQVDIGGTMVTPASFNGAMGNGVIGVLTGGSTGIINLTDASFTGLGGDTFNIAATNSTFGSTMTRTDFTGANGDAVMLVFNNSTGDININNSLLDMAGMDGVHVQAIGTSMLDIDIIDSSVMNAGEDAYEMTYNDQSVIDLFIDSTDSTGAGGAGLEFNGNGLGANLIATLVDSNLSTALNPTGASAVQGSLDNGGAATVSLTRSDITSAGLTGFLVSAWNGSTFTGTLTDVDASSAGLNGIRILAHGGSTASLTATNVDASGAGDTGLNLEANDNSSVTGRVTNFEADGATNEAFELLADVNSSLMLTGDGVSGSSAGLDAISIRALGGSDVNVNLVNAASFAGAGGDGLFVESDGPGSSAIVGISGTGATPFSLDNAGDAAISMLVQDGAFAATILADMTGVNSANDGLRINAANSTANVSITNGDLSEAGSGAGDHGVELNYMASLGTINLTNSQVDNAFEDAFHITANGGSTLNMKLTTVSAAGAGDMTFDLAGADPGALNLFIDPNDLSGAANGTFGFNISNGFQLDVTLEDTLMTPTGGHIVQGVINSGADAVFRFVNSDMSDAPADALNIVADGMGSSFLATFDATSDVDNAGDNALDLTANNGAAIGIVADGATFNNAMGGTAIRGNFNGGFGTFLISNFSANMSGNFGLEINADNDARVLGSFSNGSFDGNAAGGIKLITNADLSLNDNSLIDLDFNFVSADGNFGDGMNAMAFNGNDLVGQPQTTGVIVDFSNGSLSNNSNMNLGDGIGFGVAGMANGDGSGAQNTRVTFTFINTNILNNEEGPFDRQTMNGGSVDFSFTGGMLSGLNGIQLCADGPGDVLNFVLNGTVLAGNPTGPGLLVKAINDGIVNAEISNVDFSNNGEEGVRFLANTGGNIALTLRNLDIMSNGQTGSFDGIYGTIGVMNQAESLLTAGKFANVELNLVGVNIGDNPESAIDIDVASGGVLETASMVIGGTFGGVGQQNSTGGLFDEVELNASGAGSYLGLSFDGTTLNDAVGDAFNLSAMAGANLAIGLNNIAAQRAGGDALDVLLTNSSMSTSITGFDGRDAGGQGAAFSLMNGSFANVNNFNNVQLQGALGGDALDVTVNNSQLATFRSNNLNVSGSANTGLDIDVDSGIARFDFDGVNSDGNNIHGLFAVFNNGSTGTLNVNDIWAQGNTNGAPFVANVLNGSTLDTTVTNGAFTGSSVFVNNVQVLANSGSTANATFNNINANGPMINGFFFDYQNGSTGNVVVTNAMAQGATNTGVLMNVLSGSNVTANLNGVTTDGAMGDGVAVMVDSSTANATLNNITATGVMGDGVRVEASTSTVNATLSNINSNGVGNEGVEINALNSTLTTSLTGIQASNVGGDGVVLTGNNSIVTANVNNVTSDMADSRGIAFAATNGSTVNVNSFNNINVTNAGAAGIYIDVINSQLPTFVGNNVTANASGRNGAWSGLDIFVSGAGALADFDFLTLNTLGNAANGILLVAENTSTVNFDATTFNSSFNLGDGVVLLAGQTTAGSQLNANFVNGSASSNGPDGSGNGVFGRVSGAGTSAQVLLDAVVANVNRTSGVDLGVDFGGRLDVTLNNGFSASGNNGGDGVLFNADGPGTMASLTSTSGTNQFLGNNGDGVDFNLTNMATATDITVVGNASQNFGDGLNVTTDGSGVTINNLALTNGSLTANNNIGTGIVIDLNNVLGMTAIDVSNFQISGNQGFGNPRGVAGLDVALANMTLASVTLNGLDVTGNPGGTGVGLQLDNTTVTGNVQLTNFDANTNGGSGVDVALMNGSSVGGLTVSGSASGNLDDGISIVANDGSPQTIASLVVGGGALNIDNNGGTGLIVDLDNISGLSFLDVSGLTATGNGGAGNPRGIAGIDVAVANTTLDSLGMANLVVSNNPGGTGVGLLLDGTTVNTGVTLTNFTADGNGGGGVSVDIRNASTVNSLAVNGSASGNLGGDGLSIVSNVGAPSTINAFSLSGAALNLNNNAGNGLTIDFDGVMGLTDFDLSSLAVSGNTQDQINVRLANMTLDTVTMSDVVATGPGALVGVGDGIEFTFDGTTVNNLLRFERITSTDNGEDGLQLSYLNGATTPIGVGPNSGIDVGVFDNNGLSGIHVSLAGGSSAVLDVTNSTALVTGTTASASNNLLHGLNIELTGNSKLTMGSVDRQLLDNNTGAGVLISSSNSDFLSGSSFTNNSMSDNGSFGFFGRFLNGTFDIAIGDTITPGQGNLINSNVGAGIAIEMIQATTGRLAISDNQITNTANDGDPMTIYQGDAIVVSQLGTIDPAQATNTLTDPFGGPGLLIQRNLIGVTAGGAAGNNAGHGITFQLEEQSSIDGLSIDGNMIANSGLDGVNLRRFDSVEIMNFEITNNMIFANNDDGVDITGENDGTAANLIMTVTVADNDIMTNGNNGIELQVNADAGLNVDILRNNIIGNENDGINATETILDTSDFRMISGTWDENVIANNQNRGIFSSAQLGFVTASNNVIGAVIDVFGQVLIDGNGSTGVLIQSSGLTTTNWSGNQVIRNGRLVTGNRAAGHGFDFEGSAQVITMDNNLIRENFQDGIEVLNSNIRNGANGMFGYTLIMSNNRVQQNLGRGLDILNRADGDTIVSISGDTFNSNQEEGIYAVNTSSTSQNQTDFANAPLASDGTQTRVAQLALLIDNATVANNGNASLSGLLNSTGLIVRSGTTSAPRIDTGFNGNNPSDTSDHFATNGSGAPIFTTNNRYGGDGHGGVFVSLTNSTFGGNFGDDTFFHGFESTGTPPAVGGTFNDMEFTPGNRNNGDPLARLDLVIGVLANGDGNVFDSVNFINAGRNGTPGGQAGAFYQSSDATFKSRDNMQTPPGPFPVGSVNRRRNAQRTPIRAFLDGSVFNPDNDGVLPFAGTTDNGQLQYPGMGDSTFRVSATSGNAGDLLDLNNNGTRDAFEGFQGFGIFDDDSLFGGDFGVIESNGEQNGVGYTGGINGELPFGWGTF